ncbi:unnamed protein product [Bemisia tabaci]|uniref:Uncharacterized protein n=1 Tax=Bemisia tabaci TaxID=7038 RepID=A0A9P0A8R0_BEMTA|nr:unnamed protein product [Bemisia tabaci]
MTKTQGNSVLTASVPSPELIAEVESHVYTYCKVIIRNVIEPVLLALCDRPRFDAQILPRMKTVDSILNNSPRSVNQESENHPSVRELDFELKGLKNDLKTIMQIQEALAITDNHGSMEVLSPCRRYIAPLLGSSEKHLQISTSIVTY